MSEFGRCGGGGRRSASRMTAPLIAVFMTRTRSHSAVVIDVSSAGVRLGGDDLPEEGTELVISIETVRAFGRVAWVSARECGIAFDDPLPADAIETFRQRAASGAGLTIELKAAYDDWNAGFAR